MRLMYADVEKQYSPRERLLFGSPCNKIKKEDNLKEITKNGLTKKNVKPWQI